MQSCRIIFSKSRKMYATDLKGKRAKEESASKRGEMRKMKTWEKKSAAERKTGIKEGEGHEEDYAQKKGILEYKREEDMRSRKWQINRGFLIRPCEVKGAQRQTYVINKRTMNRSPQDT